MIVLSLIMAVDIASRPIAFIHVPDTSVESAVLLELNRARADPTGFARALRDERGYYHGNLIVRPGAEAAFVTQEGVAPVNEAIAFVEHEGTESALLPAPVLTAAAVDHQQDQNASGLIGHVGSDGTMPSDRVHRRGGSIYVGEVIAYGATDPADIVRQLIIDDGVADRGHRRLLFDPSLRYAGVACGAHPVYRYMCVLTLGRTPDGEPIGSALRRS